MASSHQNLNQQQQIQNLNNLNKPNPQQLNSNKNEPQGINPMNMSSNFQFNPTMPLAGNMQSDLSSGFPYFGANSMQQGLYPPMLWYYPPSQNGSLEQYSAASTAAGANAQMPFMPYPMAYYVNPYMFAQQQEGNKDAAENLSNVNAKARKNIGYGNNASAYHGMNQNV